MIMKVMALLVSYESGFCVAASTAAASNARLQAAQPRWGSCAVESI
jgi:hypothetical protein